MNIKAIFFGFLLVLISGQVALAQSTEIEKEITEISKQKWQWMADKNADAELKDFREALEKIP